jgi:hypothetical protein
MRQRNEIEMIANAQGMRLMEIESEVRLQEMSDQVLEAVFDSKSARHVMLEHNGL